jgi:zinc D-Ala-D-Ala carboxypeptidase
VNLSPHFTIAEMSHTSTGLNNTPSPHHVDSLITLCTLVLEPWRALVGPLKVTSGYRAPHVNLRIGGAKSSQHLRGEAADVVPVRTPLEDAWRVLVELVEGGLPADQAIVYQRERGHGWIHVSHSSLRQRGQLLVQLKDGKTYVPWRDFREMLIVQGM